MTTLDHINGSTIITGFGFVLISEAVVSYTSDKGFGIWDST